MSMLKAPPSNRPLPGLAVPGDSSRGRILTVYIFSTLPQVKNLLRNWHNVAESCEDSILREQALDSLHYKAFHCQGGAVFSLAGEAENILLRLIVAYQTICDYLDNLCDRAGSTDGTAFEQLHQALFDALTPDGGSRDYYRSYPCGQDGGYLKQLVEECQKYISQLPRYDMIYREVLKLVKWYSCLQVKKHISVHSREEELKEWIKPQLSTYTRLQWQEFAAASGSTLALFALFALAAQENLEEDMVQKTFSAYFPWICGLHILLDYMIDQQEDREGGDLNFTFYYRDQQEMRQRLELFINEAHQCASLLPGAVFHHTVVDGLLALYLSDRKVKQQGFQSLARAMLKASGPQALQTYNICRLVRVVL